MSTRPNRVAQTSTEVKKLYKRNGSGIPERQQRQLERAADLEKRAQGIREREERNTANKKKREEKERKDAALRKMNGVGLATQMVGYSHTQAQLKKGMEAFLGYTKNRRLEQEKKEQEVSKKLEAVVEAEASKEPWDDDDTFDVPNPPTRAEEQFDDDLDDDTLLELHDSILSDPVGEKMEAPNSVSVASSAPARPSPKTIEPSQGGTDFVRLHGPVNKIVDSFLEKLPDPLVELLSHDHSADPTTWDPSPALLHKLNPPGVPPHRLRIKVGCVVTVLRDLNSSSQLSKSQHLQILRIEQERLECLVLDGQLEGTKTILTKVPFAAKYRNERNCPYQRNQFPIQVSQDRVAPPIDRRISQSGFKKLTPTGQIPPQNPAIRRTASLPKKAPQIKRNPSFKLPGLPASKSMTVEAPKSDPSPPTPLLDGWDDFLDTATQIARDLSSEPPKAPVQKTSQPVTTAQQRKLLDPLVSNSAPPLSTQDFDFSLEDLDEIPELSEAENQIINTQFSKRPFNLIQGQASNAFPRINEPLNKSAVSALQAPKHPVTSTKPPNTPALKRKFTEMPNSVAGNASKRLRSNAMPMKLNMASMGKPATTAFRTSTTTRTNNNTGAKRPTTPQAIRMPSFSDFGISTQDAVSFFDDDDELAIGSPPIAV